MAPYKWPVIISRTGQNPIDCRQDLSCAKPDKPTVLGPSVSWCAAGTLQRALRTNQAARGPPLLTNHLKKEFPDTAIATQADRGWTRFSPSSPLDPESRRAGWFLAPAGVGPGILRKPPIRTKFPTSCPLGHAAGKIPWRPALPGSRAPYPAFTTRAIAIRINHSRKGLPRPSKRKNASFHQHAKFRTTSATCFTHTL